MWLVVEQRTKSNGKVDPKFDPIYWGPFDSVEKANRVANRAEDLTPDAVIRVQSLVQPGAWFTNV